ncbi:hypothetical protein AgCh_034948 [Apium graveolens]
MRGQNKWSVGSGEERRGGYRSEKIGGVPSDLFGTLPGRQTHVLDRTGKAQLINNNHFQPEKHIDETSKLLQSL